jgi:tetratricopeptide (TPR) repeat protein
MLVNFLARMPGRLGDAQKVLETPWKPAKPLRAWESMQQKQIEFVEQARLNLVRLAALEAVTEPAERKKQIEIVEAAYKQMASVPDIVNTIPVWLLRVEAGLALARDDINGGIVKLDSALSRVPAEGGDVDTRVEILQDLSQAYVKINQTGSARPLLQELVQRRPANVQARVRYADVLITEQRYDEAKEQLDVLRRGLPDNVVVERMYVRLLGLRPAGLREQYARYPEETREQRVIKLTAAGGLGDTPEILRLSKLMLEADPGDVDAAVIHVQARAREDRAAAAAVLETALKAKPDDKRLAALRDALAAETPEAQAELLRANVEKIADPYEKEIARAELARRAGKPDEAVALLRKAQAIKPDEQRAYEIEFNLLIAQSKFDEAARAVDALGRVNADQTFGELTRARLSVAKAAALTTEDERKKAQLAALEEATVVTQKYPQIAAATLLRAQLLQQLNRLDEAITQYTAVLTRTPTNVEALRGSIQSLLMLDRRAEAKKQIDEAIRIAPNDPALRRLELVYNINFGDMPRAIAALEDDLKQRPTDPQAWGQLGEVYTTAATLRGGKNDPAGEKDLLQKAADLYAKAVPLFPEDLRFAGLYAGVQRRLGNADEAEKVFKQLTETNAWKDRHEAHQLLADQYTRSNKLDLAESVLVDILNRFDPPPTQPLIALSQVYVRLNRVNDALAVLERKKSDPAVARQRIELLLVNNQLDAARAAIEEALAGKPTPELYVTAAVVELRNNQIDKADGFIAAALRDRPGDAAALYYRAQIRLSRTPPQTSEAIADLTQVVQLSPGNAEARITLANQFLLRRERDKAIEQLQAGWDANRSSKPIFLPLVSQLLETGRAKEAERVVGQAKEIPAMAADQDVILAEANVALATGNNNKAVETAKKAYAVAPSNAALRDRYYDLLLRAKSYRDVLRDSDAVVKADASLWTVHRQRGIAMRRLADPAADKEFALAFDGALKARNLNGVRLVTGTVAEELGAKAAATLLEPVIGSDVALRMILAETYQKSGDAPAAVAQYERSLEDRSRLSPDQVKTLLAAVGGAYLQLSPQAVDKARRAYEELLTYTPDDLMLLNNLAFVLTLPGSGGNPADALKYSEKAYALSKAQPPSDQMYYIWDTHGWALVQNNRRDEGVSVLREAAANARFPDVHLHLAEALLAGNDTDNAELALEKARRAIEDAEAAKGHVDAGWRPKYEQLSLDLAAKRKNALGAAN